MTLIMIILAVIGGATLSIQAAINGQLGSSVGVFKSAFLTFSVGALVTAMLIFFFEPKQAVSLMDVPKWQLLGALCGVPYIVIMVLAVQRIGTRQQATHRPVCQYGLIFIADRQARFVTAIPCRTMVPGVPQNNRRTIRQRRLLNQTG